MAGIEYAVEIGAWVESDTPKKNGAGMRKVWVAGSDGDRLSVIARTDGKADRHLVTLPVGTLEDFDASRNVLALASRHMDALAEALAKAAKPAPKPAPKAPTPPPADPGTLALFADAKAGEIHPASRRTPPPAPKAPEAVAANRAIAVANARAAKPAPAPRVAAPAPAPASSVYSPQDWASLIG